MMIVIISMVVIMVRAMSSGMRMLTISRQAQGCQNYICPEQNMMMTMMSA